MKQITYTCNLCGAAAGDCILFAVLRCSDDYGRACFSFTNLSELDHYGDIHICESCKDRLENTFTPDEDEGE